MAQSLTPAQRVAGMFAALALAVPVMARYEGYEHVPYQDGGHVWTVCYGHTGKDINTAHYYSDDECMALLTADAVKAGRSIQACTTVALPPKTYAALMSFNLNTGAYCKSTAHTRFEAGQSAAGCAELKRWTHVGTAVSKGLVNRRAFEYNYCMEGLNQ